MQHTTITDPMLDAVVPATPRWRVATGIAVGVVLLVAAGVSATLLRPGVIPSSTGGGTLGAPPPVITAFQVEGSSVWQRVEDVTGPDVAAAWLTTDDPMRGGESRVHSLPEVLHRGERAWLVIRWSGSCGSQATVHTVGVLGNTREEQVPDVFTPHALQDDGLSPSACADGS